MKPIAADAPALRRFLEAYEIYDIEAFLERVLPPEWAGIRARILETGVTMSEEPCAWAPRWTPVPPTKRVGRTDDESRMRSIIYRVHDCLHQLWGLPQPALEADNYYEYKRAQMCGEVVVLTLCEFVYVQWLYDSFPELGAWIEGRCAVMMLKKDLRGKTTTQIATRLDEFLHQKRTPRWVKEDEHALAFAEYYTPMLQRDRDAIEQCWQSMKAEPTWVKENLQGAPLARFSASLSGSELSSWMIADFEHLMDTTPAPDWALVHWNRARRATIVMPQGWHGKSEA